MSKPTRTILILGGGVMQLPAIRIAREKNWRVIVADADGAAPGSQLADIFLHVDLKDKEAMTEAAASFRRRGELDGVFTAGTDFSSTVAWVAERLGLPGIDFDTAMRATDKSLMREAFVRGGAPAPRFVMVTSPLDAQTVAGTMSMPVVVKPVDNMGSRGIRRVDRPADIPAAVEASLRLSRASKAIIEQYVEGPEFSIDAIVENGRVTICGVADRKIVFPPYFVEMGHTLPTQYDQATVETLVSAFEEGVRALGITNGAAKGDVKLSADGPVIGEIAARLSGGYMSGWTYPYASGVQPTSAALDIAVGLPAAGLEPRWNMVSAERAFISIPGVVAGIVGYESACQLPAVKNGFLRIRPGDHVRFPTNNVEKCGNFISQADTHTEAIWAAEEACRRVVVNLVPGNPETESFLFGRKDLWAPSAYRLDDPELQDRLAHLPLLLDESNGSGGRLSIMPFPGIEEVQTLDWHGRSLIRTLEMVQAETGIAVNAEGDIILGRVFWQALVRGGIQGGVWVVETVRRGLTERHQVERLVTAWSA